MHQLTIAAHAMSKLVLIGVVMLTALITPLRAAALDTRLLSERPKEVYGAANVPIVLRLGNGGAGPTGLLRALASDYIEQKHMRGSIAWYQDISPNTLRQLQAGTIDIALVYERRQEQAAIQAGFATHNSLIFNDHFLIAGPRTNPAHILPSDAPVEAFKKIARWAHMTHSQTPVFLSRDDHSATNEKEQLLWRKAGLRPWLGQSWYRKDHVFPKPALSDADRASLYTLTDHGTWLSSEQSLVHSRIYVIGGDFLRNPCNALLTRHPSTIALSFLSYLHSSRAQTLIARFGATRYHGQALFTNAAQQDFAP